MKLTDNYLTHSELFAQQAITIPKYDTSLIRQHTLDNPEWVHFGGGNLYRCFHTQVAQELLNSGDMTAGIVLVETLVRI